MPSIVLAFSIIRFKFQVYHGNNIASHTASFETAQKDSKAKTHNRLKTKVTVLSTKMNC